MSCESSTKDDLYACIPGCFAMTPLQLLSMECRSHCPQLQMLETCSEGRYAWAPTHQSFCDLQQHRSMPDRTSRSACTLSLPLLQKNALCVKRVSAEPYLDLSWSFSLDLIIPRTSACRGSGLGSSVGCESKHAACSRIGI